jgi:segregation and condensation protein B
MGVRGKIEAVIYAAEEPVTLAQLAALFGEEALAERSVPNSGDTDSGDTESREPALDDAAGDPAEQLPLAAVEAPEIKLEAAPETAEQATEEAAAPIESEANAAPGPDAEKRAQRLRERQQREAVRAALQALMAEYDAGDRGMEIREIAGGYRVATKPEYHDAVRAFAKSLKPPMKLSLQALETLAVIAYKQPVTAPEVSEIRGVDSGGVMGSLISRKLVTTAGRKQVLGRPILYKTTKEFLLRFGLKDLAELPSMEEFERMAGELQGIGDDPEAQPQQASLPVDGEGAESDMDSGSHDPDAGPQEGHGAPGEGAGLEVPQEPAQSVIVVDEVEAAQPGFQVTTGGTAAADPGADLDSDSGSDLGSGDTEARVPEEDSEVNEKDEANHG